MSDGDADFSKLLVRFNGLGKPDQKAILESFSAEDRIAFENAIEAVMKEDAAEQERLRQADRQYLGYSQWLATLVEQAVNESLPGVTDETRKAIVAEHNAMRAGQDDGSADPLVIVWNRIKSFFSLEPVKPA